jgi:hypothetical protein
MTVPVKSQRCAMVFAFVHSNEHRVLNLEEILEYNDCDLKQKRHKSHSIIRQYHRILWKCVIVIYYISMHVLQWIDCCM